MGTREDSTDWYEVLGVPENAGQAEIRRAYLEKARQVHPDRHAGQDDDRGWSWTEVNARAAEVNQAYEVLGDEDRRREYDAVRRRGTTAAVHESGKRPATAKKPASGPGKTADVGLDGAGGWAFFRDLPERTQKAILFRQQGLATDEVRVRAASTAGRWMRLGLAAAGWTLVLMTTIDTRWTAEQTIWLLAGTMVITAYTGSQLVAVHRAWTALLKPWVYVTPLYVVVAVLDRVRFEPIWRLSGIKRFEDRNGAVDIVLEWGDRAIRLRAGDAGESERVVATISSFRTAIARAVAAGDIAWWVERDEFASVRHNERATERPRSSWAVHVSCQLATGLTGLALMGYAVHVNEVSTDERWYRHGGTSTGSVAESQPERSRQQMSLPPAVSPPVTGTARWLTAGDRVAPLEIRTQGAGDYLVKLVDVPSGRDAGTVYVRGDTTVEVEVPLGTYAIRYATGPTWYGYDYLFGPETAYAEADETFVFKRDTTLDGWSINGFTVILYPVIDGNLSTTRLRASEF